MMEQPYSTCLTLNIQPPKYWLILQKVRTTRLETGIEFRSGKPEFLFLNIFKLRTTSVTLLAGELLKESKDFIEEGMHPQIIIRGYRQALNLALEKLQLLSKGLKDASGP